MILNRWLSGGEFLLADRTGMISMIVMFFDAILAKAMGTMKIDRHI